ncbi:MAG TPA: ribonuclease III [Prolixibacteraceae bacterium]|nr:ribonuclease III [Prolixibacteraceae bacterium]
MIKLLYQRIKLFSSSRKEFYLFLKDILGFYPGNLKLYDIAFIHKSASTTDSMGNLINNERLEYLGDAILGAVVAEFLYNRFPQRGEGFLTQMRSKLVNRAFLTQLTNETGLHRFIKSRTIGNTTASNIYGDAFEALIGAIYLDKGFDKARYVIIKRFLNGYVDLNKMEELDNNYKSQLIEWGQKNKLEVNFLTEEENTPNSKFSIFVSTVEIGNEVKGKGYGSSKKESQQNAARDAIQNTASASTDDQAS